MAGSDTSSTTRRSARRRARFVLLVSVISTSVLLAMFGSRLAMADIDLATDITLATDYRFRGVSQTRNAPAAQVCVAAGQENGWSAYLWASNVDFVAGGHPDDGARVEMDVALGYARALSDRVSVSANFLQYFYPGTKAGIDYDYTEWIGSLSLDDRHSLSVAYAPDVFASGKPGVYVSAGTSVELSSGLSLSAEIGHYDLHSAYGGSYQHGTLALSGGGEAFTWQLAYHVTSRDARMLFDDTLTAPGIVLGLNLAL